MIYNAICIAIGVAALSFICFLYDIQYKIVVPALSMIPAEGAGINRSKNKSTADKRCDRSGYVTIHSGSLSHMPG